jgi:cytidine deaminase
VSFPYNEFFDKYFRVSSGNKPYLVPFTQARNPADSTYWLNKNVSGTYAPSSLRSTSPLMQVATLVEGGHNSKWGLNVNHWQLARLHICDGEYVPVESLAAFLFRDYAFETDDPSAYTMVSAFANEFGYELGGEAFTHLYETGDSAVRAEAFEEVQNREFSFGGQRTITSSPVRRIPADDLGVSRPEMPSSKSPDGNPRKELRELAIEAAVDGIGAAVGTADNKAFAGSRIGGDGWGVHAVELAISQAVSKGADAVEEVVVYTEGDESGLCGRCLQAIADTSDGSVIVFVATDEDVVQYDFNELYPSPW